MTSLILLYLQAHEAQCPDNMHLLDNDQRFHGFHRATAAPPSPQLPVVGQEIDVGDDEDWGAEDAEKFPHYHAFPKKKK